MRARIAALALALAAACGGRQTAGPTGGGATGGDGHPEMPPGLTAFHDLLAPLWHAPEGDQRADDTCAAVEPLRQRAGDLVIAPAPAAAASDESGWRDATAALVHAVEELRAACAEDGRPAFATAFHDVHEAFHLVLVRAGAGH
jgi:hypothetical protein